MSKIIRLITRNIYGRKRILPDCPTSLLLLKLTGRKTFYEEDLKVLLALGYIIEMLPEGKQA